MKPAKQKSTLQRIPGSGARARRISFDLATSQESTAQVAYPVSDNPKSERIQARPGHARRGAFSLRPPPAQRLLRLIVSATLAILMVPLISCSDRSYNLGEPDYYKFHLEAGRAMCAKMQECYGPFLRTLRPEYQRQINLDTCQEALKHDLKAKIAIHTPEMQQLSRACYGQLLQRNCKEFLVGTVFIPACQELTEQTSAVFQKHPALMRSLLSSQEQRMHDPARELKPR
ncbi:MAG: hypothetical protein CMN77_11370 [Spirochaetaceae bacterium]|nr:hypothetical protein [Spirochaetaceae bacterium]|tara:strand:- start:126886 stop:127575 length:690 start_codon:yes stop_codon:yes gene_type:complete